MATGPSRSLCLHAADDAASGAFQTDMGSVVSGFLDGETFLQALLVAIDSASDTVAQSRELKKTRMQMSTYGRRELMGNWVTNVKTAKPIIARADELIHLGIVP